MGKKSTQKKEHTPQDDGVSPQLVRKGFEEKGVMAPLSIPMGRRRETLVLFLWVCMVPLSVSICGVMGLVTFGGIVYLPYFDSELLNTLFTVWCMILGGYVFHISQSRRWTRDGGRADRFMDSTTAKYFSRKFVSYFPGNLHFDHDDDTKGDDEAFIQKYLIGEKFATNFTRTEPTNDPYVHRSLMFCYHPHGLFGFGVWSGFIASFGKFYDLIRSRRQPLNPNLPEAERKQQESTPMRKRPRMFTFTAHTLTSNFFMPVWREFLMFMGMCDVARGSLLYRLSPRPNELYEGTRPPPIRISLLVPGGAAEAVDCCEPILTLKNRKGFVKVALETGAALVPVFCFGETSCYRPLLNPSLGKRFLHKIQKILHLGTPLVVGRGMFNYKVGLLPHRVPLTVIVGKPIEFERKKKGTYTEADVNKIHAQYVEALTGIYRKHVGKFGGEGAPQELQLQ